MYYNTYIPRRFLSCYVGWWSATLWVTRLMLTQPSLNVGISEWWYVQCNKDSAAMVAFSVSSAALLLIIGIESSHIWSGTVWSISVKGLWWWGCRGVQCALLGPRAIWPLKAGGRNGQGGRGSEIQLISVSDSRIHEQPGYCHSCMGSCNAKHSLHRKGNYYKCTQDTFQDEQISSLRERCKKSESFNQFHVCYYS